MPKMITSGLTWLCGRFFGKSTQSRWGFFTLGITTSFFLLSLSLTVGNTVIACLASYAWIAVFLIFFSLGLYWFIKPIRGQEIYLSLGKIEVRTERIEHIERILNCVNKLVKEIEDDKRQ